MAQRGRLVTITRSVMIAVVADTDDEAKTLAKEAWEQEYFTPDDFDERITFMDYDVADDEVALRVDHTDDGYEGLYFDVAK